MSAVESAGKKKIAFVGWNEFQLNTFGRLISKVFGDCDCNIFVFDPPQGFLPPAAEFLARLPVAVNHYGSHSAEQLDKQFDVIVAQTVFPGVELMHRVRLIFLQYGLAKESYNYGAWRALATQNLVFGEYSARCLKFFCEAQIVGNYFDAIAESSDTILGGALGKLKLLYLPTWGELSSIDDVAPLLEVLAERYEVFVKPHHNSLLSGRLGEIASRRNTIHLIDDVSVSIYDYLGKVDVVISDWSGAVYDAIYMCKPVVLIRLDGRRPSKLIGSAAGLDFRVEELVQAVVKTPDQLLSALVAVNLSAGDCNTRLKKIYSDFDHKKMHMELRNAIIGGSPIKTRWATFVIRLLVRRRIELQERYSIAQGEFRIIPLLLLRSVHALEKCVDAVLSVWRARISPYE